MQSFIDFLKEWDKRTSERVKMQQTYLMLALVSFIVAGVIGLSNHELGRDLLFVPLALLSGFLLNWIIWTFINTNVTQRFTAPRSTRRR